MRKNPPQQAQELYRLYIPFTAQEINKIDDWGFSQRIRARTKMVRGLVFKALAEQRDEARR